VAARAVRGLGLWSQVHSNSKSVSLGFSSCENLLMLSGVRMST
jgi:hypothetical protein